MKRFIDHIVLNIRKLNVSQIIIWSFLGIVLIGALLLWLPISSRSGKSLGLITALFTATSATCVTGLALGDTYCQWSIFGQIVILSLIEIGGLGFMSIASLFFFSLKRKVDLKSMLVMAQSMGTENMEDVIRIQKKILLGGLLIEAIGAAILSVRFVEQYSISIPKAIWLGVFHSISAFCNAGFDLFGFEVPGSSLMLFQSDAVVLLTIAALIIIGGIGFVVWDDLTSKKRPSKWTVYTKIVLLATVILIAFGTIVYMILEYENKDTIGSMPVAEKILNAFFQSVSTRTAGFAAIDQGKLTETGKLVTILLMFIGGASGSTAGGLKVATFVIIALFMVSRMRGQESVNVFSRRISEIHIMNALCLFGMMAILSFGGAMIICGTSTFRFIDSLFETVSALATVGLSTGVLSGVGIVSELLLIVYMFFGRIGILTISMGFLQKTTKQEGIKYPEVNIPIG